MKFFSRLLLTAVSGLSGLAFAQTTAYLHDHGQGFWFLGASNTTPIVMQTAQPHNLSAGQTVGIWNVIFDRGTGCGSGGILQGSNFKVKAVIDPTHFSITDFSGVDVPARGAWCDGSADGYKGGSQTGAPTKPYPLVSGMKGWFDGDDGTFTRSVALGTHNGLTSLAVSGNKATVVTSFPNYVTTGMKVAIWNSGNTALNNGGNPYTVTADSETQFHFTVSGVSGGTYSSRSGNMTCGPSGNADCLRLSTRAFTGNPWWDAVAAQSAPPYAALRATYDGGTFPMHAEPNAATVDGPTEFNSMAIRLLVDQTNTAVKDSLLYWVNNVERFNGVGFAAKEDTTSGGVANNIDFFSYYVRDVALMYAVARPYLTPPQKADFIGKIFNDITDPVPCHKQMPLQKAGAMVAYPGGPSGTMIGTGTLWLTDPDPTRRLNHGDAIYLGYPGSEYYVNVVNSDTSVSVITADPSVIATPTANFYMVHHWQSGDCGAIWLHGHWFGAETQPALYPQGGGYSSNSPFLDITPSRPNRGSNNSYSMQAGYIAAGLAAADDDSRALQRFEKHESSYFDYFLPFSLGYRTGFEHSGSFYSWGRTVPHSSEAASFIQMNVVGFPDLGLNGKWMTRVPMQKIFDVVPDHVGDPTNWWYSRWGTEFGGDNLAASNNQSYTWAVFEDWALRWNPTSPEAGYLRNWLEARGWWHPTWISRIYASRLFMSNSDQTVASPSYTALPTQYLFQDTSKETCDALGLDCPANMRADGIISRTGWTDENDTHVLFQARSYIGDHDLPMAGSLRIYKRGYLMSDGHQPAGGAQAGTGDTNINDNILEFNGTKNFHPGLENGDANHAGIAFIDRWAGSSPNGDAQSRYMYAEADVAGQYSVPIDRAKIHVAHFKKPGTEEIIMRYFDVDVSSSPMQVRGQVLYPQNAEAGGFSWWPEGDTTCPGEGGCPNLNSTRLIHTQEDGLLNRTNSLTTRIFSPGTVTVRWDGAGYTGNQGHAYRASICGGASCGSTVSGMDYLEVHKLSAKLDDTLTATELNPDGNWAGVQTTDKVALFSRAGRRQLVVQTVTTHPGTAQYLIAGLDAGQTYRAYRRDDGTDVASQAVVEGDNTFYFEGPAGNYAIFPEGLANLIIGTRPPAQKHKPVQYDFKVTASRTQYLWTVVGGKLPPGMQLSSDGVLSGTPSESGTFQLKIRAQKAGSPSIAAEAPVTLTVAEPPIAAAVTAVTRLNALLQYGVFGLDAQTHCGVVVSDRADFGSIAESFTDAGGAAVRQAVLGETARLAVGTRYYVQATCGSSIGTAQFTTASGSPIATSIPLSISPPAGLHAATVEVQYGASRLLGGSVTAACDGGCIVSIPALSDEIVYLKRLFLDASARVIAQSSVTPVAARQL